MSNGSGLRALPKVDRLASIPELAHYPPAVRTMAARSAIEKLRAVVVSCGSISQQMAAEHAMNEARLLSLPSMRRVVNMSGVVLHTGLGRARLAREAVEALALAGQNANLELDLDTGKRGDRQIHVRNLLCELTGAVDAFVVNNAAAAVLLSLSTLASKREVILSRGQMVEIGGSFRMPDIVRQSGCVLVEVGCTNRTKLSDYEEAVTESTGAILRCHPSNFAIVGFSEEAEPKDLADFAHRVGSVLIDDQGSGLILDTSRFGMTRQPTLQDSLASGSDIVIASGDKLLGGPQSGILLGRGELIALAKKHPLARALRVDKMTLAALESTLRLYRDGREMEIPTWRYLGRSSEDVKAMANRMASALPAAVLEQAITEAGSGAAPGTGVPTWRVGLGMDDPERLLRWLRGRDLPIIGRIEKGKVWLDPRTVEEDELAYVVETLGSMSS